MSIYKTYVLNSMPGKLKKLILLAESSKIKAEKFKYFPDDWGPFLSCKISDYKPIGIHYKDIYKYMKSGVLTESLEHEIRDGAFEIGYINDMTKIIYDFKTREIFTRFRSKSGKFPEIKVSENELLEDALHYYTSELKSYRERSKSDPDFPQFKNCVKYLEYIVQELDKIYRSK